MEGIFTELFRDSFVAKRRIRYILKKLSIGIVGLGRLGKVHAKNIAYKIPNAELKAACSIVPEELEFAKSELGITDVYSDYREMLKRADIDAVCIVTTSSEHCWQIEAALDAGKHVFSEKPLGVDVAQCKLAEAAVDILISQKSFFGRITDLFVSFFLFSLSLFLNWRRRLACNNVFL